MDYPYFTINHPGVLTERDNDWRLVEFVLKFMPVPKINIIDLAKSMLRDACNYWSDKRGEKIGWVVISNSDLKKNGKNY